MAFHGICASTSSFRWRFRVTVPLFLFQMAPQGVCASSSCFRWRFRASVTLLPFSGGLSLRLCLYFLFQMVLQGVCASSSCFRWCFNASTSCFRWHFMASMPLIPVSGGVSRRLCLYFLFQVVLQGVCASTSCFRRCFNASTSCLRWPFRASVPLLPVSDGASRHLCLYFLFQMALHGICASTSCFNDARDELTRLSALYEWLIERFSF